MKKQHIDLAARIADQVVELADIDLDEVSAIACLMAAATFIGEGDLSVKKAAKLLADYVEVVKENLE